MRQIPTATLFVTMLLAPEFALARTPVPDPAGVIKNSTGSVVIVRQGQTLKGEPNTIVFEGDVVQTGFHGKAGLLMQDDTMISMGRRSQLVLTKYAYQPDSGNFSLIIKLLRGTFQYISGKIEKIAPDAVGVETPHATIGVRGTEIMVEVD